MGYFVVLKVMIQGGSSSRVVLGAAKLRENKRKQKKIPGSPPGPGKKKKKINSVTFKIEGYILPRVN